LIPLSNLSYSLLLRAIKILKQREAGDCLICAALAESLIVNMVEADIKAREDSERTSQVEEEFRGIEGGILAREACDSM